MWLERGGQNCLALGRPLDRRAQDHGVAWLLRRMGLSGFLVYFSQGSAGTMGAAVLPEVQEKFYQMTHGTPRPCRLV